MISCRLPPASIRTGGQYPGSRSLSVVINAGDRVYWNNTAKKVTKTNTDHAIGWGVSRDDNAGVSSANGDTDAMIDFTQEVESATY